MMLEEGGVMLESGQTPADSFSSNLFHIFTVQSWKKKSGQSFPHRAMLSSLPGLGTSTSACAEPSAWPSKWAVLEIPQRTKMTGS